MLLNQALALHQSGRRTEAEAAYRAVLAAEPQNAQALHLYGVLRHQSGDSESAVALINQAIAHHHPGAECWFNLGLARFRLGQFREAAEAFSRAIQIKPDWPEPHYDLGNTLTAANRLEEAARAYRNALRLRPDYHQAAVNLANVLKDSGKTDQAIAAYRRVLRTRPDLPEVHNNLGAALQAAGDLPGAEAAFREAIRLRPDFAEALGSLTAQLGRAERFAEALPMAMAARQARPDHAPFVEMHADSLRGIGKLEQARDVYREALALEPARHTARFGLAETFRLQRNGAAAEAELRALVEILPNAWQSHHDLANVLRDMGRFAEAEAEYRLALALRQTPTAKKHLGAVLRDQQKLDEALDILREAAAADPRDEDTRYNLSITHLTAGQLKEGFALYESRLQKYKVQKLPGREWAGQDPRGRTVFVAAEQGLGDTIQFVRYLPVLAARGARIVFRAPPALHRLLAGFGELLPQGAPPPRYDYFTYLMSLPGLLRCADPVPIPLPYLTAEPEAVAAWRARLAKLPTALAGRTIGLVWAGNPGFAADHLRSIPLPELKPLAAVPNARFISLQKGATTLPDLPINDWTPELTDMADTAALVMALDLVIAVDTGVAHLAAALGKPVWMLNRFDTCWRWLTLRTDSIWYPTLRLFRQVTPGDWSDPLREITASLQSMPHDD